MGTKARRVRRLEVVRALARLQAQSRLNAGDAQRLGRVSEERAWLDVAQFLTQVIGLTRDRGLPVQMALDAEPLEL